MTPTVRWLPHAHEVHQLFQFTMMQHFEIVYHMSICDINIHHTYFDLYLFNPLDG